MKSLTQQESTTFDRFKIGFARGQEWWTNTALNHMDGTLTNESIVRMNRSQLEQVGFTSDGTAKREKYSRPSNHKTAESQAGNPGEEYWGVHRAIIMLRFLDSQEIDRNEINGVYEKINPNAKQLIEQAKINWLLDHTTK